MLPGIFWKEEEHNGYIMPDPINIASTKLLSRHLLVRARNHGLRIECKEFIGTRSIVNVEIAKKINNAVQPLVFTSSAAVNAYCENKNRFGLPVSKKTIYCLQGATRKAVLEMGDVEILATAANADELANKIIANKSIRALSFCCGKMRLDTLPEKLKNAGIALQEIQLYETLLLENTFELPFQAIFFFSPSAVNSFLKCNSLPVNIPCFCIGSTTAAALRSLSNNPVLVAEEPSQEAVIEMAIRYFIKKEGINI